MASGTIQKSILAKTTLKESARSPDIKGELGLLDAAGMCWWRESDDHEQSATFQIRLLPKAKSEYFSIEFSEFIKEKNQS